MKDSLIFKYAPKNIQDLEINDSTKVILKTFIAMDNLNILFIGNSGCGKSTLIKVLINEYYKNIPYNLIENNILTINSLKEQGISYYRSEVKTFCQTTSAIKNKKKLLILDDIDIINEQSQQVFRNCIDKYSQNVFFLASCINPQKVIDSIQSRINILKLNSFSNNQLQNILNKIVKNENISIDKDAIDFIINISNNSVRILINYLEKFKLLKNNITLNIAHESCTNILFNDFLYYTNLCIEKQLNNAINTILNIYNKGYSVMDILDNYFLFIKITDIIDENEKYKIIKIICQYITIFHIIHEDEIELSLFTNNIISIFNNNESNIYKNS
jgi:DNA polymerase III delta prime subunit